MTLTIENIENETRYYEECKEKDLELLIAEKTLTGGKEVIELVTDTVVVSKEEETFYYYVVVEFINKETTQNEVMNRALKGNILVDASIPENKIFEESVASYGKLGNNIADSILYSDYLDTTNLTYDETVDNNLRYTGKNPNNYVDFNGEKWRIIGVMNNVEDKDGNIDSRIKLIRDESIGKFSWDTSDISVNNGYGVNEWSQADIMKLLNPGYEEEGVGGSLYWNRGSGTCYNGSNNATMACDFSLSGLTEKSKNLIEEVVWHTGSNGTETSNNTIITSKFYEFERSDNTGKICTSGSFCTDNVSRTTTWIGLIGLISPSDYGFATTGGESMDRNSCLNTPLFNWDNNLIRECVDNNWLYLENVVQFTISPASYSSQNNTVFAFFEKGMDAHNAYYSFNKDANISYILRPTLYLKPNVRIISGNGTKENSYKLSIE